MGSRKSAALKSYDDVSLGALRDRLAVALAKYRYEASKSLSADINALRMAIRKKEIAASTH